MKSPEIVFTEARCADETRETSPCSLRQRQERNIVHFRRSRDQRRWRHRCPDSWVVETNVSPWLYCDYPEG